MITMTDDIIIELGRIATEGYYDYQEIRITQNNRIRDIIRRKLEGIPMDKPEEKKEEWVEFKFRKEEELAEEMDF